MRYTVAHIDVEAARKALILDSHKTAAQIRTIADKRGMPAQAAIDAAMVRQDFADPEEARVYGETIAADPSTFEVTGMAFEGVNLVECFGWDAN